MYSKEDLIGRKFIAGGELYHIIAHPSDETSLYVTWNKGDGHSYNGKSKYKAYEVINRFERKTWKLEGLPKNISNYSIF